MTVVHTNGVDLLFVALNTVGGTDVVTEEPSLVGGGVASKLAGGLTSEEERAGVSKISVD